MATTVTLEEAQAKLPELVAGLAGGEELTITQGGNPVARLVREAPPSQREPRKPGICKGMITLFVEDDEHLEGFAEYMP